MLHNLGRRAPATDPAQFLLECHERIRALLGTARRLTGAEGRPAREIAEAAESVRKYFSSAFLQHMRDEDELAMPRLRELRPELGPTLAALHVQHADHELPLSQLIAICSRIASAPERLDELRGELVEAVDALDRLVGPHLALEEETLIPALRSALSQDQQAALLAEMQALRGR